MKSMKRLWARSATVVWVALGWVASGSAATNSRFGLVSSAIESGATMSHGGAYALESSFGPAEVKLTGGDYALLGGLRSGPSSSKSEATQPSASSDLASFALAPCRPNPFSVNTSFAISVPRSQHVELGVYDIRGALVKTLVRGTIAPGRHVAAWDGRDGAGRRVAKGVYLVRLATGDFQTSAKTVYLGER